MALNVQVLTPGGVVWDAIAQSVILPGTNGQLGILPGHVPLTTFIDTGVMRIRRDQQWVAIAVMNGFAQVNPDQVLVLVHSAERGDQIDPEAARAALQAADAQLHQAARRGDRVLASRAMKQAKARLGAAIAY